MIRTYFPESSIGPKQEVVLPVFFGHLNVPFTFPNPHPRSQALMFCGHVYDGVKFSPGSSQLPPDELQDIFSRYIGEESDAAIFSCFSFPAWFSFEIPGIPRNPYLAKELTEYVHCSVLF